MYLDFDEQRAMGKYFELESQALHDSIYRREETQALRKYVVRFICINSRTSEQLDAFIPYLAVTYFDRFISKHPKLPTLVGRDRLYRGRALAICCLSLAWKMRSKSFKFKDFLKEKSEIQIYRNDIMKMEFQILDVLDWRLRAVTALCFVQYFLVLAPIPRLNLKHFSGIIIQSQGDIQFTRFKPSVIAASAILAANHFLYPNEHDTVKRKLSAGQHVRLDENKLTSCLNSMIDMCASMGLIVKEEVAQRMAVDGPSSSRQVEGETEIGAADEETPLLHKSEKEDAQRIAMEEPSSSRQFEGETEIEAADEETPLLHKSEEDAQRIAVEEPSSSRQVEGETEIGAADEETPLLHKSEKEDAQRIAMEEPSSSRQVERETEIGAADEETPLLHKSEKEDAQRIAMEEPSSSRQFERETEIEAADEETPLLHKSEEVAQRIAMEEPSSSRQVERETEIGAADEETPLLHKSEKEDAQRIAMEEPSSSRQVERETEIGAADEETPLLHKSEKEDAQRIAMEEPSSIRQVEGETEIGAADEETPLLHKSEKEDAQRMALDGSSSSRHVEGETDIVAVGEEATLLHKSEREDAQKMAGKKPSSSQKAEGETPFRHALGKEVVGSSMIQEVLVAEEEDLKWKIDDHVEADYLMALAAFDSDPEELAGIVAWLSKFCLCIR